MEYHQFGTKCVSKLQQTSSSSAVGNSSNSRTNITSTTPRRNSTTGGGSYSSQYENLWQRPPISSSSTIRPHLNTTTNSSSGRRTNPYAYAAQQNHDRLWMQRPASVNRTKSEFSSLKSNYSTDNTTTNDGSSGNNLEKKNNHMAPIQNPSSMVQNHCSVIPRERNSSATVELRQARLEQRTDLLSHRLHRLQYCQSRLHVENELISTMNSLRRALDNAATVRDTEILNDVRILLNDSALEQKLENLIKNGDLRPQFFNCDELRQATPASMVQILKKYDSLLKKIISLNFPPSSASVSSTGNSSNNNNNTNNNFSSSTSESFPLPSNVALDTEDRQYLGRVTQSLQSHLTVLQRDYDSDATESSSGGESCDEDEKEIETSEMRPSGKFRHTNLEHRASWQWWTERAWIGSRWAWIQFQLADLEYKIRQHVDLHKQLRCRKNRPTSTLSLSKNVGDDQNSKIRSDRNCESDNLNKDESGFVSDGCARTRPLDLAVGRRRIIRTAGMFKWNRKTIVRSTVHCGCFPPFSSCVTCGGRSDNKLGVDANAQTKNVRNAILEPTYHPVLSPYRGQGIGLDRKLQSYWCSSKLPARSNQWFPQPKTIVTLLQHSRENQGAYVKDTMSTETSSPEKKRGRKPAPPTLSKRHYSMVNRHKTSKLQRAKKLKRDWTRQDGGGGGVGGSLFTPFQDEIVGDAGKLAYRRTTDKHSTFDIDNIVIDPKVAAVTRVEKIHYKEIQTPEWRTRELTELNSGQESDMEDISEAAFGCRHGVKEAEEKKRFIPILFRDLHTLARRAQLLQQSSMDSNGSVGGSASQPSTPISTTPAVSIAVSTTVNSSDKNSDVGTPATELAYEPFTPRQFPLEDDEVEEILNESNNDILANSKESRVEMDQEDEEERPPSI